MKQFEFCAAPLNSESILSTPQIPTALTWLKNSSPKRYILILPDL